MLLLSLLLLSSVTFVNGNATDIPQYGRLLAPVYRLIETGNAWVFPNSSFDLGARSMSCECFDPSETCCMPKSTTIPPFCALQNESCCANTYCLSSEICCGDFCCPAQTTCNVKLTGSGCCPIGKICNTLATCYDYSSSNCSNTLVPAAGCCPASTPYCRDFAPNGLGCYPNSTAPSSSASDAGILITTTASPSSPTSSGSSAISSTITPTRSSATLANFFSALSTSSSSTIIASCHARSNFKTPDICPPATTTSPASSTSTYDLGYSAPGVSVYRSQVPSRLQNPLSAIFNRLKAVFQRQRPEVPHHTTSPDNDARSHSQSQFSTLITILVIASAIFLIRRLPTLLDAPPPPRKRRPSSLNLASTRTSAIATTTLLLPPPNPPHHLAKTTAAATAAATEPTITAESADYTEALALTPTPPFLVESPALVEEKKEEEYDIPRPSIEPPETPRWNYFPPDSAPFFLYDTPPYVSPSPHPDLLKESQPFFPHTSVHYKALEEQFQLKPYPPLDSPLDSPVRNTPVPDAADTPLYSPTDPPVDTESPTYSPSYSLTDTPTDHSPTDASPTDDSPTESIFTGFVSEDQYEMKEVPRYQTPPYGTLPPKWSSP